MTASQSLNLGATGNGRVLALVSPMGNIEWLCLPCFDSPSVFARLLDTKSGGCFAIEGAAGMENTAFHYIPNTNVLRGRFSGSGGEWEVLDFAPWQPNLRPGGSPLELIRIVRPLSGSPRLRVRFEPRFDYGRVTPRIFPSAAGLTADTGAESLRLAADIPVSWLADGQDFSVHKPFFIAMRYGEASPVRSLEEAERLLAITTAEWRRWAKTCAAPDFAAEEVLRSALCLKLHIHEDTGAIIAAATTSIPEAQGSQRTWDYRYCWLRDAAFVVEALRRLSHLNEGEAFIQYIRNVAESGPLQPVYGIDGRRNLEEIMLPHLPGYRNNGVVRTGNAAYLQKQNDLMGEILLCVETLISDPRIRWENPRELYPLVSRMVHEAIAAFDQTDTGIWEYRSIHRQYSFSQAMCWAAVNRGARIARRLGEMDDCTRWSRIAGVRRERILARAFNEKLGFFTQALDGQYPDASNLLLPMIGFIHPHDPRFLKTLDAYARLLTENRLMLRYRNLDDFGETTSAFTICSFWWAEALALAGRESEAVDLFNSLIARANPLGLYSEDIDPVTGELLGNFPQAYTHVGLIHAATTISRIIEAKNLHSGTWE